MVTIIPTDSSEGDFGVVQIRREEAKSSVWEIVAAKPTMSNIAHHIECASNVHFKTLFMRILEITSRMSGFVSIVAECIFVKKIGIFGIQISRIWVYHFFGGFWGPSKFPS